MQDFTDRPEGSLAGGAKSSRLSWGWVLSLGCGGTTLVVGGVVFMLLVYVGIYGPETSVYTGNRIPARFMKTIESVGALEDDETILYFYSDALTDIREGFYFVSNRKVVIYSEGTGRSPLNSISFEEIAEVELYRNEAFYEDSEITLLLQDGEVVSFPVSSENDRDQQFFEAIRDRLTESPES